MRTDHGTGPTPRFVRIALLNMLVGFILGAAAVLGGRYVTQPVEAPVESPAVHANAPRSDKWHTVRKHHLETHPFCRVCESTRNLEVHHIKPFSKYPELELDPTNLITLCSNPSCMSHLTLGHLGNYKISNPHIVEDADRINQRRTEARK